MLADNKRRMNQKCPVAKFIEVYTSPHGGVYQCNGQNCFWLEFQNTTTFFPIRELFRFKKYIDSIDLEYMINDTSRSSDFKLVVFSHTDRCMLLNVESIIQLKELLSGAKYMVELNSEINNLLRRRISLLKPQKI